MISPSGEGRHLFRFAWDATEAFGHIPTMEVKHPDGPLKSDPSELEYSDYDRLGELLFADDGWDHRLRKVELVPGVFGWYNTRTDQTQSGEYGGAGLMVEHPDDASHIETEVLSRPVDGSHADGPAAEIGSIVLSGYNRLKVLQQVPIDD